MANPFGKNGGPANSVPRNTFDLSFQNNLTLPFGALVPCFCKEVLPGDSFRINTTFGLRFMPTAFPLQTRIRADVHFFYVRNRNLWEDWPDFYGKTKSNLSFPVLKGQSSDFYKTGSLADFLGVPSSVYSEYSTMSPIWPKANDPSYTSGKYYLEFANRYVAYDGFVANIFNLSQVVSSNPHLGASVFTVLSGPDFTPSSFAPGSKFTVFFTSNVPLSEPPVLYPAYYYNSSESSITACGVISSVPDSFSSGSDGVYSCDYLLESLSDNALLKDQLLLVFAPQLTVTSSSIPQVGISLVGFRSTGVPCLDYPDLDSVQQHYGDTLMLSALPFRAYESIYNSFYRDERNNPFVIDGEKEYNKYLPTKAGGFDSTNYQLRYRNWEQDFLTTCVASPQQGVAPLVGISATGVMSVSDPDTGQVYQVQAQTGDDADTITGFDVTETLPKAVTRSLVNYASSGISINDFRNVNAFQRWLETNIRRGYKYRDQIKSHYDVDISYQELDMPEFIGGVSCDVTPNTVSQTTPTDEPLGSYAGQLYGSGSSKNSVDNYCDEHGFIIGILSVVPVPNYSQLLPKHFLKTDDSLDYYSPEFGHIGMQAVHNQEVAPLQCSYADLSGVFGYQRAWYDYLQSVDEVHGQFRTTLRDFVMNRVFDNLPILGPSFTVIDPEQLNDVFTVREVDGEPIQPILGQLYFDVQAKRPIPRFGVPRLE